MLGPAYWFVILFTLVLVIGKGVIGYIHLWVPSVEITAYELLTYRGKVHQNHAPPLWVLLNSRPPERHPLSLLWQNLELESQSIPEEGAGERWYGFFISWFHFSLFGFSSQFLQYLLLRSGIMNIPNIWPHTKEILGKIIMRSCPFWIL